MSSDNTKTSAYTIASYATFIGGLVGTAVFARHRLLQAEKRLAEANKEYLIRWARRQKSAETRAAGPATTPGGPQKS